MKKSFLLLISSIFSIASLAQNFNWVKSLGGTMHDGGTSIARDGSGNIYVTGNFLGTGDFDPGPGTYDMHASSNIWPGDISLTKLDAKGNFVWAKRIGGNGSDNSGCVTLDANGNIYIVGEFSDTVDFDPGTGTYNLISAGLVDGFITKLDLKTLPTLIPVQETLT
jgi:hypothetical protein